MYFIRKYIRLFGNLLNINNHPYGDDLNNNVNNNVNNNRNILDIEIVGRLTIYCYNVK